MNRIDHKITIDEYHNHPSVSRSVLGTCLASKTPLHFHTKLAEPKDSEAMRFGNAFHKYLLEPEIFKENAVEWAETASVGVKFKKAELELEDGQFLCPVAWLEQFERMTAAIMAHTKAKSLLSMKGLVEPSFFWTDEETGLGLKCRPDYLIQTENAQVVVDIKKCENQWKSAHTEDFWRHCADFNYDIQVHMNMKGIEAVTGRPVDGFVFLAVEDAEPYGVNVMPAGESVLFAGAHKFKKAAAKYLEYKDSREAYGDGYNTLEYPDWFMIKTTGE